MTTHNSMSRDIWGNRSFIIYNNQMFWIVITTQKKIDRLIDNAFEVWWQRQARLQKDIRNKKDRARHAKKKWK
jgi:hypothetical protein